MAEAHEISIERTLDAPVDAVWRAWTEHLEEWWAPKPWTTRIVEQDLRAGGKSVLDMRGPDGEGGPMEGIFLEVTPQRRIVFTNILDGDWNPKSPQPVAIVGFFDLTDLGNGRTGYRAGARHWDADALECHRAMGFEQGWGIVADQLEAVARRLASADA
ncbi:SRPBCC domain-containing protein [Sphingomonas sp.]|uniref:SRPBCC domain-containing protein n=1 Tax=Sphingomonas sp. TaxID=28214 RepID=UPI003B3A5C0B